jgi:hypothetical protein
MISRILATTVTLCALATPRLCVAQSDVTFKVPLNLTQVSSDIAKVAVFCQITSTAIVSNSMGKLQKQEEIPVTGGQLVMTVTVVIAVSGLDNPVGKTANYVCLLSGFSNLLQQWYPFSSTSTNPTFRLTPTPAGLSGTFNW